MLVDLYLRDPIDSLGLSNSTDYNTKLAFVHWKQGASSVVQNIAFGGYNLWPNSSDPDFVINDNSFFIKVSNNGGGYW